VKDARLPVAHVLAGLSTATAASSSLLGNTGCAFLMGGKICLEKGACLGLRIIFVQLSFRDFVVDL
jgi:hypothetical protein